MGHERSFGEYMMDIEMLVRNNKYEHNNIGRSIRKIDFTIEEINPNVDFFKKCYNDNMTPEEAIESLPDNNRELLRYIKHLTDNVIMEEVDERYLTSRILSDADTDDLEDELRDRWDTSMVDKNHLSIMDLKEMLFNRGVDCAYGEPKDVICEVLGFSNSFAVTYEDVINELKKIF